MTANANRADFWASPRSRKSWGGDVAGQGNPGSPGSGGASPYPEPVEERDI